jgi:hypothetical protein
MSNVNQFFFFILLNKNLKYICTKFMIDYEFGWINLVICDIVKWHIKYLLYIVISSILVLQ